MKKTILYALATLFLVAAVSNVTYAQAKKKKKVELKSKTVEANRGENPNIKSGPPTEDNEEKKSRAAACTVYFDNYTGLYINVYVDGNYKGQLSPYGSGTVSVGDGYTTIYCVSAGGTREWNASGDCRESYTYSLR